MASPAPAANLTPGLVWLFLSPIGRVGRHAYWLAFALVWVVIGIAFNMWWSSLGPDIDINQVTLVSFMESNALFPLLFLLLQWIELALVIKRCQDIGVTGFLGLLIFVPIINVLAVVIIGVAPGIRGPNKHGPMSDSYFRRSS
ncbi:hypothetical protein GCM10011316_31620 [Roseibium aquae]|uniref:DUF805 domain-containing protein n=1 Tax=Roseibium aquae TaxID=1323746 RepID=A0A916X2X8_9HYPH|nr:DUF805 domain-containing protein [Roseibium aquae]GGB57212.1 hypothetical protein GCM10011316_31620 [Roseibium aquae]